MGILRVGVSGMKKRLDQWLANLGYCSRGDARGFLKAHCVEVHGERAKNAAEKVEADWVRVDGEELDFPGGIFVMMNKPAGFTCSHDAREGRLVYELLPERWRRRNPVVTSVGRLDKETSGLLLLTDLSERVHFFTSPKNKVPKRYVARLDKAPRADAAEVFSSGSLLLDGEERACAPAELRWLDERVAEVVLTEGRYHQVRRMFAAVGATVMELERVGFGKLELGDLKRGEWRVVGTEEI